MFAARIQKNRRTYVHRMWLRVFNAASKIQSLFVLFAVFLLTGPARDVSRDCHDPVE